MGAADFSAPVDVARSYVSVLMGDGSAGVSVNSGKLTGTDARTISQPVAINAVGDITVAHHVTFRDDGEAFGPSASGWLRRSCRRPAGPEPDACALAGEHSHGVNPVSAALLIVDTVVVVTVLLLLALRRPPRYR
jgi:hypothetical protein